MRNYYEIKLRPPACNNIPNDFHIRPCATWKAAKGNHIAR
jgi:hypothetical protein